MRCLTFAELEQFNLGRLLTLPDNDVRAHLEDCASCRSALGSLSAGVSASSAPTLAQDATIATGAVAGRGSPARAASAHFPRIDGYQITGVLGQGGMGIVYKAIQTKLNRAVALKVLPSIIGSANPAAVQRFRREATAAARLHHTNIIPIYDFGESADAHFYAMELVTGEPVNVLIDRLTQRKVSNPTTLQLVEILGDISLPGAPRTYAADVSVGERPPDSGSGSSFARGRAYFHVVARWIADAADALHYAHSQGIIHRDIKPSNLILASDGRIMVADFGLAKSADEHSVTMTGSLVGTLRYLSPEQAMAKRMRVDHRTDVYSLGATMYELLCFTPAFPGTDDKELLGAIITRDPPAPRRINAQVPNELDTICMKCVEKSADARYATARELADDLRRYINDLPIVARPPGLAKRAWKFVRRHRMAAAVVAAVVLLSTFGVFWRKETIARRDAQIASFHESATALALINKWRAAENDLRSALKIDPEHVQTLLTLAWLKLEHFKAAPEQAGTESQEEVVTTCRRILLIEPTNMRALGYLGIALRRLERYDEAIEILRRGLDIDPRAYASWSNLGTVYALSGDLKLAEEYMRKGAEMAGIEQDPWHGSVWRNLGTLTLYLARAEAMEHVQKALQCHPADAASWILRAKIGLELSGHTDPDEALDDAKHADRLAEFRDGRAKRVRAMAHLARKEWEQADEQARLAAELRDEPSINSLIRAVANAGLGRTEDAKKLLEQAEASWPAKLKTAGAFSAEAGTGDLWIDTADERLRLLQQAEVLLATGSAAGVPPP